MYDQLLTKSSGFLPRSQLPWGDVEIVVREPDKQNVTYGQKSEIWDPSHYLESHGIIGISFLLHFLCLSCPVFFRLVFKCQIMDDIGCSWEVIQTRIIVTYESHCISFPPSKDPSCEAHGRRRGTGNAVCGFLIETYCWKTDTQKK